MNLKNLLGILSILTISMILGACSSTYPGYLQAIPDEADMHVSTNFDSLVAKADLKDVKTTEMYKTFTSEFGEEESEIKGFINKFLENPERCGIDFSQDFYFFKMYKNETNSFMLYTMKMKERGNFEKFLKEIMDISKEQITIRDGEDYKYIVMDDDDANLCWNDDRIITIVPTDSKSSENLKSYTDYIMAGKFERSIVDNPDFKNFYLKRKDVNFWLTTDIFRDDMTKDMIEKRLGLPLDSCFVHSYLDFGTDEINLDVEIAYNQRIALNPEMGRARDGFETPVAQYIPGPDICGAFAFAIDPQTIYQSFVPEDERDAMNMSFKQNVGMSIEELVNTFTGEFLIAVTDIRKEEDNFGEGGILELGDGKTPIITLATAVTDNKFLESFLNTLPEGFVEKEGDFYKVDIDAVVLYTGIFNNIWIVTNDKELVKSKGKALGDKSFAKNEVAADLKDNPYFMYFNVQHDQILEILKGIDGDESKTTEIISMIKDLTIKSNFSRKSSMSYANFRIRLVPQNRNSLAFIMDMVNAEMKKKAEREKEIMKKLEELDEEIEFEEEEGTKGEEIK